MKKIFFIVTVFFLGCSGGNDVSSQKTAPKNAATEYGRSLSNAPSKAQAAVEKYNMATALREEELGPIEGTED